MKFSGRPRESTLLVLFDHSDSRNLMDLCFLIICHMGIKEFDDCLKISLSPSLHFILCLGLCLNF